MTLLVADFVVLSIGTANSNSILCRSTCRISITREDWLLGQNRLILTILKASITCLKHWHCITLLLGIITSGDRQWSLSNGKSTRNIRDFIFIRNCTRSYNVILSNFTTIIYNSRNGCRNRKANLRIPISKTRVSNIKLRISITINLSSISNMSSQWYFHYSNYTLRLNQIISSGSNNTTLSSRPCDNHTVITDSCHFLIIRFPKYRFIGAVFWQQRSRQLSRIANLQLYVAFTDRN